MFHSFVADDLEIGEYELRQENAKPDAGAAGCGQAELLAADGRFDAVVDTRPHTRCHLNCHQFDIP